MEEIEEEPVATYRSVRLRDVAAALLAVLITTADARADLAPGLYQNLAVFHGGQNRNYDLRVPASYDGSVAVPLVIDLHGLGNSPTSHRSISGFNAIAEAQNILVAWPLGLGTNADPATLTGGPSWSAGGTCCNYSTINNIDDVGFILAVVASVQSQVAVDASRIYATGHSNGAAMSHRLACEASDLFAAAATFAFPGPRVACVPPRAIPILMIHGRQDTVVPYLGGFLQGNPLLPSVPSAAAEFEAWRTRNGCSGSTPDVTENPGGTNVCERYTTCTAGVQVGLCSVDTTFFFDSNGHFPYFPRVTTGFNTQQRAWDFLSSFTLPAQPVPTLSLRGDVLLVAFLAVAIGLQYRRVHSGANARRSDESARLCARSSGNRVPTSTRRFRGGDGGRETVSVEHSAVWGPRQRSRIPDSESARSSSSASSRAVAQ